MANPNDQGTRPYDYFYKILGGKWKPFIIRGIEQNGSIRFNETKRILGVSEKVLQQQLRELERDGIIRRVVRSVSPQHVEYLFTPAGEQLVPIFNEIYKWSLNRLQEKGVEIAPLTFTYHQNIE